MERRDAGTSTAGMHVELHDGHGSAAAKAKVEAAGGTVDLIKKDKKAEDAPAEG